MRVVSLLPSATDIVIALGATDNLVGVSHCCNGPFAELPALTSTWIDVEAPSEIIDEQVRTAGRPLYELDIESLRLLAPDVIISQSLCDVCAVPSGDVMQAVHSLPGSPTLVDLAPYVLSDVPECFVQVGKAIGKASEAATVVDQWHKVFDQYRGRHAVTKPRVVFLDWLEPPFVAGHWIPDMLEWLGVECVLGRSGEPSYSTSWNEIMQADPELVVAACCGFDIDRTRMEIPDEVAVPVICLDGYTHFNRPSPGLMQSLEHLSEAIEQNSQHWKKPTPKLS